MAPDQYILSQGEVRLTPDGLYYWYSPIKKPMRDAFAEETALLTGLQAHLKLKGEMNTASWEWLNYLLESYNNHIVEVSIFSRNWGTLKGFNSVFWELRLDRPLGSNRSKFTEVY